MRKSKIFFGSLALLSMGLYSCSSDEPVAGGGNQTIDGDRYMAVNISTAGLGATRAAGDGFEESKSDDSEGAITKDNTRFYFFDASGNAFTMASAVNVNGEVASNMVTPVSIESSKDDGNNTSDKTKSVLVLGKPAGQGFQGVVPAQAVCIVGLSDADFTDLQNKSLSTLAQTVKAYKGTSFIMSNSNWQGAGDNGAVSIADKIQTTPELAEENPAEFYMERLAVKVRLKDGSLKEYVSENPDTEDGTYSIYGENGLEENIKLQVKLDGWQLINKGDGSYLIKQLPQSAFNGWNAPAYHRSYWAVTPETANLDSETTKYNIWEDAAWKTGVGDANAEYTNEWTKATQADVTEFLRGAETTAVVIRGRVQKVPANEGTATNLDLVRWSGVYYELNTFKKMVIDAYNTANHTALTVDAVTLVKDTENDNVHKVQVNNTDYAQYGKVQYWNNGAASFVVNIKNEAGWFGVVRNHIYEYELEAVVGLGVPGNDPNKPEDTETFVAANLIELNWKLVSNKLILQ